MTLNEFTPVQAIIWDLDNTLYRFNDGFIHACNIAAGRAALHMGVVMELEEATKFANQSLIEHGFSTEFFVEEHGLDRVRLHEVFHNFMDEKIISASIETQELFEQAECDHILLTHGAASWARRVLDHVGLRKFFPDTHILGREHFDFHSKASSTLPFEKALSVLGRQANGDVLMVEDSAVNLKKPYEMGMQTALIHHGRLPDKTHNFIHHSIENIHELMALLRHKKI